MKADSARLRPLPQFEHCPQTYLIYLDNFDAGIYKQTIMTVLYILKKKKINTLEIHEFVC